MSTQAKYGIPVSGRVDVLLHKKLKEDANKYGLSMCRMVDTALTEWAQTSEIRKTDEQLKIRIEELERKLSKSKTTIKKYQKELDEETQRINKRWSTAIAMFIKQISNSNSKHNSHIELFKQIFADV